MDIVGFKTPELQAICECEREANHKLGTPCAKKLRTRLSEIQAAPFAKDLPAGNPHELKRERAGEYSLSLVGLVRLTFVPANSPIPTKDGKIDWSKVNKITIVYIGNYHDY